MAMQKITDAAGREAYYDSANDRVYTEGGNRDTYYNLKDWNTRQLNKYGAPSSKTNVSAPGSSRSGSTSQEFSDIYKSLSGMFGNDKLYDSLIGSAESIKASAEEAATKKREQIPVVQNIYSKLAQELKAQFEKETASVEQAKTEDIAAQDEEAARSGFETGTGFEASMRRNLAEKYNAKIDAKADEWQVDRERLASEEVKDIKELEAEAAMLLMQGDTAAADINAQIIGLKNQEAQLISAAASNIMNTADNREKMYYDRLYNDALLDIKERELDLSAQKLKLDASTAGAGRVQLVTDAEGNMFIVNLDTGEKKPLDLNQGVDLSETQRKEQARAEIVDDIINGVDDVKTLAQAYPEFTPNEIDDFVKSYKSNWWQKLWGK